MWNVRTVAACRVRNTLKVFIVISLLLLRWNYVRLQCGTPTKFILILFRLHTQQATKNEEPEKETNRRKKMNKTTTSNLKFFSLVYVSIQITILTEKQHLQLLSVRQTRKGGRQAKHNYTKYEIEFHHLKCCLRLQLIFQS